MKIGLDDRFIELLNDTNLLDIVDYDELMQSKVFNEIIQSELA